MNRILMLLSALALAAPLLAQQLNELPFVSKGNAIELTVANTSTLALRHITVEATNRPSWLRFDSTRLLIDHLAGKSEASTRFLFSVDRTAPVGKPTTVAFTITAPSGERWTKELTVTVAPPKTFELFQNYPNPFNPQTVISYQLPVFSRVEVRLYDILGREVMTVVDGERNAGWHAETVDGARLSSGVYLARMSAHPQSGKGYVKTVKMTLVR